jgi:CBS domain-containing protein
VIRENREPESLWVMDQMQDEVPTCRLDESVGQAGARAEERGYAVSSVVNENGIVLGVIGKRDWNTDPTASVEQLMDPAPTTLRPSDPLEKAKQMLSESDRGAVLVTDSDGRLLGVFFGVNEKKEPGRKQQLADSEGWS